MLYYFPGEPILPVVECLNVGSEVDCHNFKKIYIRNLPHVRHNFPRSVLYICTWSALPPSVDV